MLADPSGPVPRVVDRETPFESPFVTVVSETIEDPATGDRSPYYSLAMGDWVNVVAVTLERRLVLVSQYRHAGGRWTWEIPAGSIEPDEGPTEAAARELLEETGHVAGRVDVIAERLVNPALQTNTLTTVVATRLAIDEQTSAEHGLHLVEADTWLEPRFAGSFTHLFSALALHDAITAVATGAVTV